MNKGQTQHLRHRLRDNFRLASLALFGIIALFFLGPFAVYRLLIGDSLIAFIEFLLLATLAVNVIWAWRRNDAMIPASVVAVTVTIAAGTLIALLGDVAIYWAYVALVINLVLTQRHFALALNIALVAFIALQGTPFASVVHLNAFIATATLVSIYVFLFATQTERQRRRLKLQAEHDPLTGIGNRRMLETTLPEIMTRTGHKPLPHSMALLDLDRFKQINDDFGHAAGDRVLQEMASILEQSTRSQDRIFRIGGEEFLLLMPETTLAGAHVVAEKIRDRTASSLNSPGGIVTVSIGIAEIDPDDGDWKAWLERADQALYLAKKNGRNCVEGLDNQPPAQEPASTS